MAFETQWIVLCVMHVHELWLAKNFEGCMKEDSKDNRTAADRWLFVWCLHILKTPTMILPRAAKADMMAIALLI